MAKPDRTPSSAASPRCRSRRHIFEPFTPSDDLGGGAQRCECGKLLIDRTLGGGRVVEINGPDFVGPSPFPNRKGLRVSAEHPAAKCCYRSAIVLDFTERVTFRRCPVHGETEHIYQPPRNTYYWRSFGLRRSFNGGIVYLTLWRRHGDPGAEVIEFLLNVRIPKGLKPRV